MAGCASAMAEYNGLDKVGHIRDKLVAIARYVETLPGFDQCLGQRSGPAMGNRCSPIPHYEYGQTSFRQQIP